MYMLLAQTPSGSLMFRHLIRGQRYRTLLMRSHVINTTVCHHEANLDGAKYPLQDVSLSKALRSAHRLLHPPLTPLTRLTLQSDQL